MVAVGMSLAHRPGQRAQNAAKIVIQTFARASTALRMFPHARADLLFSTPLLAMGVCVGAYYFDDRYGRRCRFGCKGYVKSV